MFVCVRYNVNICVCVCVYINNCLALIGQNHPMKPHRIALTHSLVLHYDLYKKMKVGNISVLICCFKNCLVRVYLHCVIYLFMMLKLSEIICSMLLFVKGHTLMCFMLLALEEFKH